MLTGKFGQGGHNSSFTFRSNPLPGIPI